MSKRFLFLDIETTGLDPKTDKILEIAWQITDEDFNSIAEPEAYIVNHRAEVWGWSGLFTALRYASDEVQEMHRRSGLIDEVRFGDDDALRDIDDIYDDLWVATDDLKSEGHTVHLAGRSVHFDRAFLSHYGFHSLFEGAASTIHHRHLDLSSIKMMLELSGMKVPEQPESIHRAKADVEGDIELARDIKQALRGQK